MKNVILLVVLLSLPKLVAAQQKICINDALQYELSSEYLNESRSYWISLPLHYSDSGSYPVIYVLDAEWRFELIRNLVFELGAWEKIPGSIVVGIPHVEAEYKRGIDLTFSESRIEYDGDVVDSTWHNATNSGGGLRFYNFLTQEVMPKINQDFSTNNHETLVGHSYGGYFGAYILSMDHPFEVLHLYDPSIWYSNGEVIDLFEQTNYSKSTKIHLTYQPIPTFHKAKIEAFIEELRKNKKIELTTKMYESESHNSLFLDSFYKGIKVTNR